MGTRCPAGQARFEGEDYGDTDDEDKCGEDEIGWSEAVPVGVIHEVPGAWAAVVVNHDHEGDGDASDHVEREKSLHGSGHESRVGDCAWFFRETWLHCFSTRLGCN